MTSEINRIGSIKEIVEYGIDCISDNQEVTINLRDFMYIYRTLEEYMRFFHNKDHYSTIEDIEKFLGNKSSGEGFDVLSTAIYQKLYKVILPKVVEDMIDQNDFENVLVPGYYINSD